MLKKEKMFCRKCRYYKSETEWTTDRRNTTGKKIIGHSRTSDTPTKEGKEYPIYCNYNTENKNNNCEYYKEKKGWW